MYGSSNKETRRNDEIWAVGQPNSTCEGDESHWREVEKGAFPHAPAVQNYIEKETLTTRRGGRRLMETKLERISYLSRKNPDMVFTSIGHLIDVDMLRRCHEKMDTDKAVGIDGVTKAEYENKLNENLEKLVEKLKNKSYRPKPARRVEIPKENGKTRPLSIYCYEDKLVQEAIRQIFEAVFEPHFYNEMMGFRPNRNCHKALKLLNTSIEKHYTNYIVDADIKSFFNNLDHTWIKKFVESKIKDPNIIRILMRTLKSGIMEDFQYSSTESGSGQGSVCSPIIANIYMHYVLVWWFKEVVAPKMKGYCGIVVYADDFTACFQYKSEAEEFYNRLKKRLKYFGLELQEDKSRLIEFGRFAQNNAKKKGTKAATFDFLGFTHYCSTNRYGWFRVKRKTSKKKFCKKSREINQLIRKIRHQSARVIIEKMNQVLVGYYHYYGITDNYRSLKRFRDVVIKRLFFWLNKRSQRRSYNWDSFNELIKTCPIAKPKIYVNIYS